jgi:HTH-type transcriptional regulator/antitoxin HipB
VRVKRKVGRRRNWPNEPGLRQATISGIETGEKPGRLDTILALLAALDLEIRVAERSKGQGQDIEDLF